MQKFQPNVDLSKAFNSQVMLINNIAHCENGMVLIKAGADGPPIHRHPAQEEFFKVLEGQLQVYLTNKWVNLAQGDSIIIPKNAAHSYRSRDKNDCIFEYKLTPGKDFSGMMRTFEHLIQTGKLKSVSDLKSIIHLAMTFKKYNNDVKSVVPPPFVITVMAFIGKVLGYRVN